MSDRLQQFPARAVDLGDLTVRNLLDAGHSFLVATEWRQ